MTSARYSLLRDLAALVVIAAACPFAVFGGANLGCVGHAAFSGACALTVIIVSPLLLVAGGVIAGLLTRGWTGLLFVLAGMVAGMFAILLLSQVAGAPVPIDVFSAMAAALFFGFPIACGYGFARVLVRLRGSRAA